MNIDLGSTKTVGKNVLPDSNKYKGDRSLGQLET